MGISCLLSARVSGCRREPVPPARMMPFSMSRFVQPKTLTIVPTGLHGLTPVTMLEIPACGFEQSVFERVTGLPSEVAANLGGVDRVPPVVPGTIRHERLEGAVPAGLRTQPIERGADAVDDLKIRAFVPAADVVLLADAAFVKHEQQAGTVIVDMQPVADVSA